MDITNLEVGSSYRFIHERKGTFVAKFMGYEPLPAGDVDPHCLRVSINTTAGSPYAHMADAFVRIEGRKTTPLQTEKLLRPSLITVEEKVS
jgi:hypothetical protein